MNIGQDEDLTYRDYDRALAQSGFPIGQMDGQAVVIVQILSVEVEIKGHPSGWGPRSHGRRTWDLVTGKHMPNNNRANMADSNSTNLVMLPIGMVEGRGVYYGSTLWNVRAGRWFTIRSTADINTFKLNEWTWADPRTGAFAAPATTPEFVVSLTQDQVWDEWTSLPSTGDTPKKLLQVVNRIINRTLERQTEEVLDYMEARGHIK